MCSKLNRVKTGFVGARDSSKKIEVAFTDKFLVTLKATNGLTSATYKMICASGCGERVCVHTLGDLNFPDFCNQPNFANDQPIINIKILNHKAPTELSNNRAISGCHL